MAEQLASVPEESSTDFTALSPQCYSYRESFLSVAGTEWSIRSTLSSQSGQSGSDHSSIPGAGASSSYLFNISGSAAAADLGTHELHKGPLPIHKVAASMVEQLASVPDETTTGFTAPSLQCLSYRELIRNVAWPEGSIRSNLPALSCQSGSSYSSGSSALSSYLSNSGYSSGLGSAGLTDSRGELMKIAHRMVSDGYTQRMVQAFRDAGGQGQDQDRALKNWFVELDVDWVLEIRGGYGLRRQLQLLLEDTATSWQQELIDRWVRALTIIVASIKEELVAAVKRETLAFARFGKASMSAMLVFVEPILDIFKVVNLQPVLHMCVCISNALYDMSMMCTHSLISSETQSIFTEIAGLLVREESRLIQVISTTTKAWMSWIRYEYGCPTELQGGKVQKNTQLAVDYILLMRNAHASVQNYSQGDNSGMLRDLIDDMIGNLKKLLREDSEPCPDLSLRYLFRLNNYYFIEQKMSEPSIPVDVELSSVNHPRLELIPECVKYMDSYLDVSWGHVVSCILPSNSFRLPKYWKKDSLLVKFQSAFHQTYQAQKFWKVPDPQLRSLMRETITKRVIPFYRDYLKDHPELEKQVRGGSNSPEALEEMLGELFEG